MQRLLIGLALLLAVALPAAADSTVHGLGTATTSPLPASSCVYVDQGSTTDTKLCSGWAAAFGGLTAASNLTDLASASAARTNLGLGTIAVLAAPSGTVVGTSDPQTLTNKTIACANNTCTVRIGSDVSGLGTGVPTALGANVGSAGAPVTFNGALGTPSSGTGTNIIGVANNNVLAVTLATGTSVSLTAPREYYVCTSTCTVTPPVPAAGYEFCVLNGNNVTTVITLAALGSSARYENQARTAYGTAGTGTLVSTGAAADRVCIVGLDSTHYLTASATGTWIIN